MGFIWKVLTVMLMAEAHISVTRAQSDFEDISKEPTVFESTSLPTDEAGNFLPRYMASVGNGHIATTVYSETVYMNGLYNGFKGESHRARIPSKNNIRISVLPDANVTNHTYALDVAKGVFFERFTVGPYQVEQRTFAHRYYSKVLVSQIQVESSDAIDLGLQLTLSSNSGQASSDISFGTETPFNGTFASGIYQCGETLILEDPVYQKSNPTICIATSEISPNLDILPNQIVWKTLFSAYDFELEDAVADFDAVSKLVMEGKDAEIYQSHVDAWAAVWEDGRIDIEGNVDLAKIVYGSLYYILSSLPVTTETNTVVRPFFGLSPGGLAYGDYLMDYQGHSFWDTETWMYPPILYLYPQAAKQILNYRSSVIQAARDRASETGYKGARFPWEGAVTGREVTPDCCTVTSDLQVHITSDISYAIRQYIATTRDTSWLITNGCGMLREMAEFWISRAEYNNVTNFHDIKGVMPPDEDNAGVDNNGYTNIGAGYSIFYARYVECWCLSNTPVPDEWIEIAKSLALIYDAEEDYHPEFEGYVKGKEIKQADVVLMGFPQLYDMAPSTRRNDLLIYENSTRLDGPAMTWAMHTIGFLELDDVEYAEMIFNRSYQSYMRQPFKIWTESRPPNLGAVNFITGMGGFLQSILTGYGGYRLFPEKIEFQKPRVLPNSDGLRISGLDYLGNTFDVHITKDLVSFTLQTAAANHPLVIEHGSEQFNFDQQGTTLNFNNTPVIDKLSMWSTKGTGCQLPIDQIGTPFTG